jgi:hypothetical protein
VLAATGHVAAGRGAGGAVAGAENGTTRAAAAAALDGAPHGADLDATLSPLPGLASLFVATALCDALL